MVFGIENSLEETVFHSCKKGVVHIPKEQQKNWDARIEMLLEKIQYWIDNKSEKQIEIIQLYYY